MNERPSIECKPDGPYLVRNLDQIEGSRGDPLAVELVTALCRCGGSANKPFCDGTHRRNGFSSAKLAEGGANQLDSYRAGPITIHDNRSICAHAGRCTDSLAAVFKYQSEPWIDPEGGTVAQIVEAVRSCPSGALSYSLDGAVGGAEPRPPPSVAVTKDGPYKISGAMPLHDQVLAPGASTEHYTLCRCGASKNKPFCDGTHWSIGFKD